MRFLRFPLVLAPVSLIFALLLGMPSSARAGEIKFGAAPLPVDGSGNLTSAGRSAAKTEIASEPGEEIWHVSLWAKIDNGAPGPLYVEFFGKLADGKSYLLAYRYEQAEYEGETFLSASLDLTGNLGFNRGKRYEAVVSQVSPDGKNLELARGAFTLTWTDADPDTEDPADPEREIADTYDSSAQDELDTLVGGAEEPQEGGPPVIEPAERAKGCTVDPGASPLALACGVALFMLGGLSARSRRS